MSKKINTKYWHKLADYWAKCIAKAEELDEVLKSKDFLKYQKSIKNRNKRKPLEELIECAK